MRKCRSFPLALFAAALILGCGSALPAGQAPQPKAETPALITSCGQSPGPTTVKVVMQKLKLAYDIDPLATAGHTSGQGPGRGAVQVGDHRHGGSLKGMGAAGISIDDELARAAALIAEARKAGHQDHRRPRRRHEAAGPGSGGRRHDRRAEHRRRGPEFQPPARLQGRKCGRPLHGHLQGQEIPLIEFEKMMDLVPTLEKLYGK